MTKTIQINCEKAWKVIGLSLWGLVTIGIGFGLYFGYEGTSHPLVQPSMPSIGLPYDQFDKQLNDYVTARDTNNYYQIIYGVSVLFSIIDVVGIGLTINHHYRLLEIKCK